ncbi:hypothetical protein COL922a_012172 [Colletotrichum nupharicola]|nr:hypothetical protein COL922a_012172 [Colletotrichum nupharicola]
MSSSSISELYRDVPNADLRTIKFESLFDKDHDSLEALIKACETDGFFYLDLQATGSEKFWKDLKEIDEVAKNWFSQSTEVKLKTPTVSLAHGQVLLKDIMMGLRPLRLFDQFTASCHFILKLLLDCLSDGLELKGEARLDTSHRDDSRSKSTLYFLHYPPGSQDIKNVGQNMHTDIGTLTLLFAPQWGLQVFSPSDEAWTYVQPRPGHAIVNVGDTLRFLSRKRFRSALHGVLPLGGVQNEDRYSISYFLRATDSTEFKDSNEEESDATQWYLKKYEMYELPHAIQKQQTVLSGGMAQELRASF